MPRAQVTVMKLPRNAGTVFSGGCTSWVLKVNDRIIIKIPVKPYSETFTHEAEMCKIMAAAPPCPDVVRIFLSFDEAIFLSFASRGTLKQRLASNQRREDDRNPRSQILEVVKTEPRTTVERWVMELSSATAWIESLGYAHCDLSPSNLLLDDEDHLKLCDFDQMSQIGTRAPTRAAPWSRIVQPKEWQEEGSKSPYGLNGVRTESFAIGSITYFMVRNYEPYDLEDFGDGVDSAPIITRRFSNLELPDLDSDNSALDRIIHRCWYNQYRSLKDLAQESKMLQGACELPRATVFDAEYMDRCREESQKVVDDGLFDDEYYTK